MLDGTERAYRRLAAAALLRAVYESRTADDRAIRRAARDWLKSPVALAWADVLDISLERLRRVPTKALRWHRCGRKPKGAAQ